VVEDKLVKPPRRLAQTVAAVSGALQALEVAEVAVERAILSTPTGAYRNMLTDANVHLKEAVRCLSM
jgi:hypothetical protein